MKLRNKKTGEIVDLDIAILKAQFGGISVIPKPHLIQGEEYVYDSLEGLCGEWEDYEGEWPQVGDTYYAIHNNGTIHEHHWEQNQENQGRPVFNIFKTREEAKLALGKFDALERLRDKGFKFRGWKFKPHMESVIGNTVYIEAYIDIIMNNMDDLKTLFGREE